MTGLIEAIETVWIALPDGTRLAARLWLPPDTDMTPVPAVLEYIPYRRRDRTRMRDESMHPRFAAAGYAALRVDMRGTGDSDGVMRDEYSDQEIQDGFDVIGWIAQQPWCNGHVGMFGKSWGAYSAFQVAALRPPALKAIAPVMGCDDRWREDIHFYGGVLANDNFWWGSIMQLFNAAPPDPAIVGPNRWRAMWKERLEAMTFWPAQWLEHQSHDAMWQRGSIARNYDDVAVPVCYFGGWADLYRDTPFRITQHLAGPVRVVMGPWAHLYPHEGSPSPQIDFMAELIRFWDHTLKGHDTRLTEDPALRFWLQDSIAPAGHHAERPGRWVEETAWPSPNVSDQTLWLNTGTLGETPERGEEPMTICSPQTFGSAGGDMFSFAIPGDMPSDCRVDAGGALAFRGPVVAQRLDILGQPSLRVHVAADRSQGFVVALLIDEAPDGAQTLISRGFFNLTHRIGAAEPTPIVPGEQMEVVVPLHAIGYALAPGHRLMVQIASTYWPILWPSPEPVTLSIRPGLSALSLPARTAIPGEAPRPMPSPPAPTSPPAMRTVREGSMERTLTVDQTTGTETSRVAIDGGVFGPVGRRLLEETETEMGDISDRRYTIHPDDPLSARATMQQSSVFQRNDWSARIEATSEMTATRKNFILRATVECWDGETLFHTVTWHHKIPRNGM